MTRIGSILFAMASLGCGGAATDPADPLAEMPSGDGSFHYEVRVNAEVTTLDVTVCPREDGALSTDCAGYVVDLREAAGASWWGGSTEGGAVVVPASAWLRRSSERDGDARVTLSFALPDGVRAVVPWPRRDGLYRIDPRAFRFLAHTAFGRFPTDELVIGRCTIEIARLPGPLAVSDAELRTYVERVGRAVQMLHGRMPADRIAMIVVPVGPGPDPVAFGHVGRGGGGSVVLLVRSDAELDALLSDWVAVHELSHLAMPFVRREDAWISEGIATYYQEVLSARGGLQTPLETWRALDRGLASGRRDGRGDDLRTESRTMQQSRAFRRVYWGGAAFALDLDVALRRRGRSLDDLMRGLDAIEPQRAWTATQVLAAMDRLAGSDLPSRVAERHLAAREIPDLAELYATLGLRRGEGRALALDESAPERAIRDAITSPPPELAEHGAAP